MFIGDFRPEGSILASPENREYLASEQGLERAMNEGVILEATVLLCDTAMRLHVDLGCMRGIIERSEAVATRRGEIVKDIAIITRVGKPVCFKVIGFTQERGEVVALLSRRAAQIECMQNYLGDLIAGDQRLQ